MYFLDALTSSHDRSSDVEYTVASTPPLTEHSASAARKRESVVVLPCGKHTQTVRHTESIEGGGAEKEG